VDAETVYLFRHALLRDAAYQLQLPGDRARLHALALEIIEALSAGDGAALDALALDLADHAGQAAEGAGEKQAELRRREFAWLLRALEHADRAYRNEERVALGLRVEMHPAAEPTHKVNALIHVSRAFHRLGRMNEALQASRRALAHAGRSTDRNDLPAALILLQTNLASCGQSEEARDTLLKAVELARGGSDRVYIDALIMHAQFLHNEHQFDEAQGVLDELESLLVRLPTAAAKARVLYVRTMQQMERAGPDLSDSLEFAQATRKSLCDLGQRDVEAVMAFNIGVQFANRGMTAEAKSWYREALRLSDEIGSRSLAVSLHYNLGNVAFYMESRYLEAIEIYRRGLNEALESGQLHLAQSMYGKLGDVQLSLGRLEEAEDSLRRAKELTSKHGVPGGIDWLNDLLAELFIERGDLTRGETLLREHLRNVRTSRENDELSSILTELAAVWTRRGQLGIARTALNESIHCAEQVLWPTYSVKALAARCAMALLSGDPAQAAQDREALEKFGQKNSIGRVRLVAVVMPGFRKTAYEASVTCDSPSAATVARLQGLAAEFDRSAEIDDSRLSVRFRRTLEEINGVVSEVIRAKETREPVQLFNGTLPEKLTPQLRLALIDRLTGTCPAQLAQLKRERPGVLARMLKGTEGLPVPDWRSTELP
jgi:tetratricopeptide (TPR) repeat protein